MTLDDRSRVGHPQSAIPDRGLGSAGAAEYYKGLFFLAVGLGTVLLIGSRRAARDRLADALREVAGLDEAVEARDQRLELVLAASNTGIWEWDMVNGRLEWSPAIYRQHGLDPTGPAPRYETYIDTIHPDDRVRFSEAISDAIDRGGRFDLEFRIVWPDGSVHWTRGAGRVFSDTSGKPIRMIGTGQDMTERRRLAADRDELEEEEKRGREFREAFMDVISHELRTPITTIYGLTQLLAKPGRRDDPTERTSLLGDVRAEAERLYRLVEDLLVLSRVEHGRLAVETEPIELRRFLQRVARSAAAEWPSIVLSLDLEPHLPIVGGEVTYVEQILRNLLDNAAKYSPPGTLVSLSAREEGDAVAIRVIDGGPGIPDDAAERVFELFYRDPESARIASGSGIGLFVCARLVKVMGGRVWALRRPEGGSEFGFTLRTIAADDDLRSEPTDGDGGEGGSEAPPDPGVPRTPGQTSA